MALVKLILSEDIPGVGSAGDVVDVKPGHARNFLLPQGKALIATESKVQELEHHRRAIAEKMERERKTLDAERKRLEKVELAVEAQAGEGGKLFGSVTAMQLTELLGEKGFDVDRRKIQLAEPIKELGEHVVEIRLHTDVVAKVKLNVTAAE